VSSINQAKAEAQKLIKRYNQLQAEAKQADAAEASRKAAEAEKLVSQISALQGAIAKLQAKDREALAKKPATTTAPPSPVPKPKVAGQEELTPEQIKKAEAERRELESRINRIEEAQRKTRNQIDQLTRAKAELTRLREQAEKNASSVATEKRIQEEKLQKELASLIAKKEAEHSNLKKEMELIRSQAEKDAELLKVQRDAARAMMEKQKKLELEKIKIRHRGGGHKAVWIGVGVGGVMSVLTVAVVLLFTPIGQNLLSSQQASPSPRETKVSSPEKPVDQSAVAEEESPPTAVRVQAVGTFQDRLSNGGAGPIMLILPEGSFLMGSSNSSLNQDERPQVKVSLQSFSISKYEITFDEYDAFAATTGKELPRDQGWGRGNRPVINVNWEEASEYSKWLTEQTGNQYRLPSEREWEYAAAAGTSTAFWWGYEIGRNNANCGSCGSQWDAKQTAPVGSFPANAFGLHDTIGNIMEWTNSCYRSSYRGAPGFGQEWEGGNCSKRMVRGPSFKTYEKDVRTTRRFSYSSRTRMDSLGFRVARAN